MNKNNDRFKAIVNDSVDHIFRAIGEITQPIESIDSVRPHLLHSGSLFLELAELHQISPLLYRFLSAERLRIKFNQTYHYLIHKPEISEEYHRQIDGVIQSCFDGLLKLYDRHFEHAQLRYRKHNELVEQFDAQGVSHISLKGMALAPLLYPDVELRPCVDMDILINPTQLIAIKNIVRNGCRFSLPDEQHTKWLGGNHHLPEGEYFEHINGKTKKLSLELHIDAINRDIPQHITIDSVQSTKSVIHDGYTYPTLDHNDQLAQLCFHLASSGRIKKTNLGADANFVKLINLIDIVLYVEQYGDQIDWVLLSQQQPHVINTLKLIQPIVGFDKPLLASYSNFEMSWLDDIRIINKQGYLMRGVSILFDRDFPLLNRLNELLSPSEWYLRLRYGVGPSRSLLFTKLFRHPANLARLLLKRLFSAVFTKMGMA